jgi:uncharacterized repeat protein (TIGR01451 family)
MPLTRRPPSTSAPSLRAVLLGAVALLVLALSGPLAAGAQAATGEFETLASSPVDLTSIAVDTDTQVIYAQENEGTAFFSYDPRTNEWKELAEAPLSSGNNGGATFLDGKIYTAYTQESTSLGVYDIASNSWSTIPNPLNEGTADITAYGGDLYLASGTHFAKYDPATETTTPLAEPPLGFSSWGGLQPYNGKIYGDIGDSSSEFEVYDVASDTWTELAELPGGAPAGSALDPVSGAYFAYGNYGGTTLYRYDIAGAAWTTSELPFEVGDGGLVYVSLPGKTGIYLIQGEEGTGFGRYSTPEPAADLSAAMTANPGATTVGGLVAYTVKVSNAGPGAATGVVLTDALPAGLAFVSAAASQGGCSGTATVACSLGALASGAGATVTITVRATAPGALTSSSSVSAATSDPNAANNSAAVTVTVAAPPSSGPPPVRHCVVPKMRGFTLKHVRAALSARGCKLGKLAHHYNKVKKGGLVEQRYHQGTILPIGTSVSVWISLGHRPRHHRH